jgi:aspartate/methionine/tyrosine aminotransferase
MNIKQASRLNLVKEYYFSKKLKEIADLRAAGKDIINLGIGNPDLPPSDASRKKWKKLFGRIISMDIKVIEVLPS